MVRQASLFSQVLSFLLKAFFIDSSSIHTHVPAQHSATHLAKQFQETPVIAVVVENQLPIKTSVRDVIPSVDYINP